MVDGAICTKLSMIACVVCCCELSERKRETRVTFIGTILKVKHGTFEINPVSFAPLSRQQCGTLRNLGTHYVDTGMGLERITAVLNNKSSNYDTDLFMPIFSAIQKVCYL